MLIQKIELESKLQSKILKEFNKQPKTFAFKINPPPNGIPDAHVLTHGVPFYFEVKRTASDEARKLQEYRIAQLNKAGGTACVVRSVDEARKVVYEKLKKLGVKPKVLLYFK